MRVISTTLQGSCSSSVHVTHKTIGYSGKLDLQLQCILRVPTVTCSACLMCVIFWLKKVLFVGVVRTECGKEAVSLLLSHAQWRLGSPVAVASHSFLPHLID
jgi:hypothetical protein